MTTLSAISTKDHNECIESTITIITDDRPDDLSSLIITITTKNETITLATDLQPFRQAIQT